MTYTRPFLQSIRPGAHRIGVNGGPATEICNVRHTLTDDHRLIVHGYRVSPVGGWRESTFAILEGDIVSWKRYQVKEVKG